MATKVYILKRGDKGSAVKELQRLLKINPDGSFGGDTETAVKKYQKSKGLLDDGEVGPKTAASLGLDIEKWISTDLSTSSVPVPAKVDTTKATSYTTSDGLIINKLYLDKDEYVQANNDMLWLVLHHTAGGHDPYRTVKMWNDDNRGRIATQYVIGNISTTNGDAKMDGVVVECFPNKNWAYHLGENGSSLLHPKSVGIEICNYGWLELKADGKFYNYVGGIVPENQVCDLGYKFRDHRYYHKYSEKQIEQTYKLCKEIARNNPGIDLKKGLQEWLKTEKPEVAFGYKDIAYKGTIKNCVLTHTNIRKDKSDCSPQPLFIQMINSF